MDHINHIEHISTKMSTKEARKRLGKAYRHLNDDQVDYIVLLLSKLANETVQDLGSKIIY